jgi:hypothetical protein
VPPQIIDLVPAGTEVDGSPLYATQAEASSMLLGRCVAWLLVNHSPEILRVLGLVAIGGLCLYFVSDDRW